LYDACRIESDALAAAPPAFALVEQVVKVPLQLPRGDKLIKDIMFAPNGTRGGLLFKLGLWGDADGPRIKGALDLSCSGGGFIRWGALRPSDCLLLPEGGFLKADTQAVNGYEPERDVELSLFFQDKDERPWFAKAEVSRIGLVKFSQCVPARRQL
jgi:hypothetical protein